MLLVRTKIAQSSINGIGLFAEEFIAKGTLIWQYVPGFDLAFTEDQLKELPGPARDYLSTYSYKSRDTGRYILDADNARFYNHSQNPNTISIKIAGNEEGGDIATRDIEVGEEITCDYQRDDIDFEKKLNRKNS